MSKGFDASDPAEVAAKDQVFQMLAENVNAISHLAGSSNAQIMKLVSERKYIGELKLMCQIVLTELEGRKPDDDLELCWPPSEKTEVYSPGWKFIEKLIRPSDVKLDEDEASVQATTIFGQLIGECLVGMQNVSPAECLGEMKNLRKSLEQEIESMKDMPATEDVVVGLHDWLWLLDKPEKLLTLTARLAQLAQDELSDGVQLVPLHEMQLEIRKCREEENDA